MQKIVKYEKVRKWVVRKVVGKKITKKQSEKVEAELPTYTITETLQMQFQELVHEMKSSTPVMYT